MLRFEHPYAKFLDKVEKPSRYTGAEHGARKKAWDGVAARVCLAFPDIYDIGMSHLGFRMLYKILNDDPRTLAERAYTPWVDMQAQLRQHGKLLVSLESVKEQPGFELIDVATPDLATIHEEDGGGWLAHGETGEDGTGSSPLGA